MVCDETYKEYQEALVKRTMGLLKRKAGVPSLTSAEAVLQLDCFKDRPP